MICKPATPFQEAEDNLTFVYVLTLCLCIFIAGRHLPAMSLLLTEEGTITLKSY